MIDYFLMHNELHVEMFLNNMLNKVMHLNEYEINFHTIELFHFDILVKQMFLYEMEVYQKKRITKKIKIL